MCLNSTPYCMLVVVLLIDASRVVENPLLSDGILSFIIMFCFPIFSFTLQQVFFIGAAARYWSVTSSVKPVHLFFEVCWTVHHCDNLRIEPTRCYLLFYCISYRLNMFRALLCPSSRAQAYSLQPGHYSNLPAPNLQPTANQV